MEDISNAPGRDPKQDVTVILSAAFDRHAAAIEEYRFYVPVRNRAAYEAAWEPVARLPAYG